MSTATRASAILPSTRRHSALYELSLASSRELLRNAKTIVGLLFMFFWLLIVLFGVNLSVNGGRPAPVVGVVSGGADSQVLVSNLRDQGFSADLVEASSPGAGHTAVVSLGGGSAQVVLAADDTPSWIDLAKSIHSLGIPSAQIVVSDADGWVEVDIFRENLGTALVAGLMAIAFMGTSVPLVALRQRGTLRLLGTTPVKRLTFIVSQSPVRFLLGVGEAAITLAIAWSLGYVESLNLLRLGITLVLGLGMLQAFGYLLASRAQNVELVGLVTGAIPILAVLTTIPLPPAAHAALNFLPTSWLMQAIGADLAGTQPFFPVYALWAMMAAIGVAAALLAARLFRWDQAEGS
jgi:ABC-2 type transport system permease protein